MPKLPGRSAIISDDEDDYLDEDPLPSKKKSSNLSSKRKKLSDSDTEEEVPTKQSKNQKGTSAAVQKTPTQSSKTPTKGSSGSSSKNPREKFQQTQSFRTFMNREPPRALGSKEIPQGQDNCLEGLTFVITGVFESIDRDETKNLILRYGGRVTTNLCKSTSYLVAGRDCGQSKLDKAEEFHTKILDEDALFDLIRRLPGKKSKYEIAAEKEASQKGKVSPKKGMLTNQYSYSSQSSSSQISSTASSQTYSQPADYGGEKGTSSRSTASESLLWVDKYKPTEIRQIIGQQGDKSNAKKLLTWLLHWRENYSKKPAFGSRANDTGVGHKAALLSGPPGVGKTTTAQIVCKELGFSYVELNASDTRSKRSLQDEIAVALGSRTLVDYLDKSHRAVSAKDSWKHCLIMDEVDGMAGNEDRGGVQELIQLIKKTKVPVICICNDRSHPKIRSLSNYCFDLRFQRPRVEQIKGAIMSMAFKEGLKVPPAALNDIIVAANQDIRQVIHNLSMWTVKDKNMTYEQFKTEADNARKDLRLGAFDVCRKVFVGGDETANMTLTDKIDLFFNDYSIIPLFVQENYLSVTPYSTRGSMQNHLKCISKTCDSIAWGDIVDGLIRRGQSWNLLPIQAVFSSVIPGDTMRGGMGQMINFPSWLGKNSTQSKNNRLIQELSSHMAMKVSANKKSLSMEYLPYMRSMLSNPLAINGAAAVESVISRLDAYNLMREDFDSIMELTAWSTSVNPMEKIDSKVKAAFTRTYNKTSRLKPYATGVMSKKSRKRAGGEDDLEGLNELGDNGDDGANSENSDEEDITQDSMIKQKKNAKAAAKLKQLNDIEEGNYTPPSSKKSLSPKKAQTQKQSPSPKKSKTTVRVDSPKKGIKASQGSRNNDVPVKAAGQMTDKKSSVSNSDKKASSEIDDKKLAAESKKDSSQNGTQAGAIGKEKALLSSIIEPVNKKTKASKSKESDDADDFEKPRGKEKVKDTAAGKTKAEAKPADTKTKGIASYFMPKPKTT